jgi:glycosyltransferase involved in cell wall biosynthesis
MSDKKRNDQFILMVVYNAIQYDARVIRAAETISSLGEKVVVISCNSDESYLSNHFKSISFNSKLKGGLLLFSFWYFVVKYSINNRNNIKLLYLHDYYLVCIGRFLNVILNIKWIYDAHELLIERKGAKSNWRKLFFIFLEKYCINHADLVIAANRERERIIKSVYKLKNTINVLNISPNIKHNQVKNDLNKEDYIVYQGYLSKDRDLEDYILLLTKLPINIKLKIIGGGPDLEYYKKMVSELNLTHRVKFSGLIPYSRLIEESRSCKIGIVSYSLNGLNNYYCSPNKLYEYAQLNMPMIFSPQPFLSKIAQKYGIGEVISKEMAIDKKVELVKLLFENITFYQTNMVKFLSDFTYENEMNKLKKSVAGLLV